MAQDFNFSDVRDQDAQMFAYASWMAKHGGYANGMTIRDYFAAKAMLAIMGSDRYTGVVGVNNYVQSVSRDAYKMADAMLEARK